MKLNIYIYTYIYIYNICIYIYMRKFIPIGVQADLGRAQSVI